MLRESSRQHQALDSGDHQKSPRATPRAPDASNDCAQSRVSKHLKQRPRTHACGRRCLASYIQNTREQTGVSRVSKCALCPYQRKCDTRERAWLQQLSNYLCSAETVSFLRPFARRRANTERPFFELMRERNPCVFARFRFFG